MLVAVLNIVLGLIILMKNKNRDKSKLYFSLMYFSAGLWSGSISLSLLIINEDIFLWFAKFFFIFATMIFLSFLLFCIEFPYKMKKLPVLFKYLIILATIYIFYISLSNRLLIGVESYKFGLREVENSFYHLIYGMYFFILLIYSYYSLFYKYFNSSGVNKSRLLWIIVSTLISFTLGIFFRWYLPYKDAYDFYWLAPIFIIFMNFSITYLLFKKD